MRTNVIWRQRLYELTLIFSSDLFRSQHVRFGACEKSDVQRNASMMQWRCVLHDFMMRLFSQSVGPRRHVSVEMAVERFGMVNIPIVVLREHQ